MIMNAFALHDVSDRAGVRRWSASGIAIVAAHAALIALFMNWYTQRPPPGATMPAIMIDMAPISAAPQPTELERAPDRLMEQADASPPEPVKRQAVEEQIAPTPLQEKPEVVAPPEQKVEMKTAIDPAKPVPAAKPTPVKPRVVRPDAKKPNEATPAPRTAAPPRVERQAQAASAASAGATASAIASYNQRVRAHLMRFHQYPSGANGQRGVATLSFTVNRSGQVSGGRLGGSSGIAAFDAQAMAMIRQASPFPAIPPEIPQGSISFTIPVAFTVR